ncbi:MAG: PHP domain-containing protein [Lentisphaerae bacterium]|nr:PHP domain-containing protein [Lentisphaerota bacterium]
MIDLHAHSTYSDGTLTPAELVERAAGLGLKALALTDHDGTDGVGPLLDACEALAPERRLEGIPGVEISAEVTRGTMHLLAYFVDVRNGPLQETLARIRAGRSERNVRILERLRSLGCPLDPDVVAAKAGEDVVGRPHIAEAMVERGYVKNRQKAFEQFLAKGKPAYVDRFRLPPAEALAVIAGAGGVAVVAHPISLDLSSKALRRVLEDLKMMGLQGVEVYYPLHTQEQTGTFTVMAKSLDLVATGGSDFHGGSKPGLELGRGFGDLEVPDVVVDQLRARRGH